MKEQKYIYKIAFLDSLEETLNTVNNSKLLANVLNLEGCYLIVWED